MLKIVSFFLRILPPPPGLCFLIFWIQHLKYADIVTGGQSGDEVLCKYMEKVLKRDSCISPSTVYWVFANEPFKYWFNTFKKILAVQLRIILSLYSCCFMLSSLNTSDMIAAFPTTAKVQQNTYRTVSSRGNKSKAREILHCSCLDRQHIQAH